MKLIFLGSGSSFPDPMENFHSNMLVVDNAENKLLIDCGSDIRHSMYAASLTYKDIDAIYISHFHADHIGGLEWLAFNTKFDVEAAKPKLYIHPSMSERLWEHALSGGLQSIEGAIPADINTYFSVQSLIGNKYFIWNTIQFELVKTIHVYNGKDLLPSYGLFFTLNGVKIYITTDTQFFPDKYMNYFLQADIIFHDCEFSKEKTKVHAPFDQLNELNSHIKRKMWLYHADNSAGIDVRAHGFLGLVKRGQIFDF